MTIITSEEQLEKMLKEAKLDVAQWRVYHSWEEMMDSIQSKEYLSSNQLDNSMKKFIKKQWNELLEEIKNFKNTKIQYV